MRRGCSKKNYPGFISNELYSGYETDISREKDLALISLKYLKEYRDEESKVILRRYLSRAFNLSLDISDALNIPDDYAPCLSNSWISVCSYPPDCYTYPHTDHTLFTMILWRSKPKNFVMLGGTKPTAEVREINPMVHYGQILEELGIVKSANYHKVLPDDEPQYSLLFFARPSMDMIFKMQNEDGYVQQYPNCGIHSARKRKR